METLAGEHVVLRPATLEDVPRFVEISQTPEVLERWGEIPASEFVTDINEDELQLFAIEVDGAVAGMIQFWEETDHRYRHASIDIFLAPQFHCRGLGPDAVRTLARHLVEVRGHHRVVIDPAADNRAAISAYAKVGFKPVGVMRQYERLPGGDWHDGLLMELLAAEWPEARVIPEDDKAPPPG